jgi:uncharacterized membrane protein
MAPEHDRNLEVIDPENERLQGHISAFSNAVFAFAITLLILDIRLPEGISKADLPSALVSLWPNYMAFLISFFVIGLYWSTYIRLLREISRTDRTLLWLILLFLLFIVIIPFSTYLISQYLTQLTVIIYAAIVACAGFAHTIIRVYAGHNHRLVSEKYSSRHIERNIILSLIAPICFTVSIGIAFLNSLAAQLFWILIFIMHIILGRMPGLRDL